MNFGYESLGVAANKLVNISEKRAAQFISVANSEFFHLERVL